MRKTLGICGLPAKISSLAAWRISSSDTPTGLLAKKNLNTRNSTIKGPMWFTDKAWTVKSGKSIGGGGSKSTGPAIDIVHVWSAGNSRLWAPTIRHRRRQSLKTGSLVILVLLLLLRTP